MPDRLRTLTRAALVALSIAGVSFLIAGLIIWLTGGFRTDLLGIRLRASDPLRPVLIGAALIIARLLLHRIRGLETEAQALRMAFRAPVIAAALAVLITCVASGTNYGVGGGSDSYGYVSQADLWIDGHLTVEQEWLRGAPWPYAIQSAAPLAYRPAVSGLAIVPVYAPGLPLLFAGAKILLGQCGIVAVIAVMAGLLVAATYAIGRRVASPQVGAAAAWLIATCPVVLFMMASPMSDVPAAAMSAAALLGCLQRPHRAKTAAFLAGLAMATVVLIRPNLAPLVALLGFWLLVLDRQTPTWSMRVTRCALFGLGAAPGAIVMALVNASLYGSATESGYGRGIAGTFFSSSHILPNIRHYSVWLIESQTPIVVLGLLALAVPARWLAKRDRPSDVSLLLLVTAGVTALYLPYLVFDTWWYLRFFLPAWPVLAIGTAWLVTDSTGRTYGRAGLALLLAIGAWGVGYADLHAAFTVGWGDLRYVSAAHVVREITAPGSVILSMQHSGSLNYYSGRHTLRYDWIERHRLDSAVQWLKDGGHDVYILIEEWEADGFRERFKGTTYGALAEESLVFRQNVGTRVLLYDTRSHLGEMPRTITEFVPSARRCPEPYK